MSDFVVKRDLRVVLDFARIRQHEGFSTCTTVRKWKIAYWIQVLMMHVVNYQLYQKEKSSLNSQIFWLNCFYGKSSLIFVPGSGGSLKNSGSLNSLQRRFLRNVNTSLEALGREGETLEEGTIPSSHRTRRATKLGIAVIIELGSGLCELER